MDENEMNENEINENEINENEMNEINQKNSWNDWHLRELWNEEKKVV